MGAIASVWAEYKYKYGIQYKYDVRQIGGDLTDVGAIAIGRAINKEFNLMDAGC